MGKVKFKGPGVYIGMDEAEYFSVDACGTSDLAVLFSDQEGWWWQSRNAPDWKPRETGVQSFGSALHKLLLEGQEAFDKAYYVIPEPADIPGLLRTTDDIKTALQEAGAPKPGSKINKPGLIEMAKIYIRDQPIWDEIVAEHMEKAAGRLTLSSRDYRELTIMLDCASRVPDLRELYILPEVRLAEISVFFEVEPVPGKGPVLCRFRFDSLFPTITNDLKSLSARTTFFDECSFRMSDWKYRLQAGWSFKARQAAYEAITEGRLHGGSIKQRDWIKLFPSKAPLTSVDWMWTFFQRPNATGKAPAILPVRIGHDHWIAREGYQAAMDALVTFVECRERFGMKDPWFAAYLPVQVTQDRDPPAGWIRDRDPFMSPSNSHPPLKI